MTQVRMRRATHRRTSCLPKLRPIEHVDERLRRVFQAVGDGLAMLEPAGRVGCHQRRRRLRPQSALWSDSTKPRSVMR